mgnify:CR=1 FL=1
MENWYINPIDGEVSLEELQEKADNGEFHEWNFEPFEYQENGYEDVVEELRKYRAVDYIALDEKRKRAEEEGNTVEALGYKQQMDKMVEDVLKIYRSKNIFPIQYFSELGVMDEIEKCIAYKAKFDGNTVSCVSGDTEYFNGEEWKPIKDYTEGEKVLQYNVDGTAELVEPLRYIHKKEIEYFYVNRYDEDITSGYEIPMKITGDHRVPYFHNGVLMIEPLKVVLAKAETGMIEMDSLIPRGCIYGGTVKVDRSVLDEAYSAVMYQEFVSNNDLITIVNDSVCFSDECCRLELEDRKYLLGLLGIEPEDDDIELENDFFGIDIIKSINNFLSLTYRDMCLWRPTECEYTVVSKCDTMCFDEGEYDKIYEANKYCFSVPSTLLVLRRNGIVFITGNCGAGVGTGLCRWLFPNLFDTPSAHDLTKKDAETQYKKFLNDEYLKRAIKFCYSYKDGCPVPTSVEGGLRLVGSAPSNFRPMNAKAVYERFCPKGGTIYDFCCVDGSTEFFTGTGWKRIDSYVEGDKVLQFNEDGTGSLVEPIDYINYESSDPFYEFDSKWLNSCLTGNHDIIYRVEKLKEEVPMDGFNLIGEVLGGTYNNHKYKVKEANHDSKEYSYLKIKQEDILNRYFSKPIPLTFEGLGGDWEVDRDELCLLAYCHNCTLITDYDKGNFAVFVTEKEKIDMITQILDNLNKRGISINYTYGKPKFKGSNGKYHGYVIEFQFKRFLDYFDLDYSKVCNNHRATWNSYSVLSTKLYSLSKKCSEYFAECVLEWNNYCRYDTYSNRNSEIVQYMCVSNSFGAFVNESKYGKSGYRYCVEFGEDDQTAKYFTPTKYKAISDSHKYCFTVPSHMLVLRRKGRVFITGNCGFGGRMLGALSSKNNYKYIGTDPCTETMYHLHQLGEYIEMVTGREDSYELHCCGSEDFRGKPNSIDFAFSSPPYFNLEVYSDEPTQCYNKFPKLEEWLEGYVRQTIKNIYNMLKPGCFYAVNIADFKVGNGGEVAYVDEWKRISAEEGMPLFDTVYLGVTARAGSAEQAAGELKKENIMVFKKPL